MSEEKREKALKVGREVLGRFAMLPRYSGKTGEPVTPAPRPAPAPFRCCERAQISNAKCHCAAVTTCTVHGERHHGSHD